jgi:hypothetical protein
MATSNKDFKVKYGLIVEGANATVNGNQVLTETASDQYIIDLIGGETLVTSVESTQMEVINGELNIKSGVFDVSGAAAQALSDAEDYTDTALLSYTPTASLDTTIAGYGYAKTADLPTMYSDADVDAHLSGGDGITYSSGTISADVAGGLHIFNEQIQINRDTVDGWYDASGDAAYEAGLVAGNLSTHEQATTGIHGVTGNIVGTSDSQTLTNKTIGDVLTFNDGSNSSTIDVDGNNLYINANDDLTLSTATGDIVLDADGGVYVGSVSAGNTVATNSYVDNAVSGLTWKQAVHLLYDDISPTLSGSGASQLIVDGHDPLGDADSGYRLLLAAVGGASTDGIYVFNSTSGNWTLTRADDADTFEELVGAAVYVMEGTQFGGTSWVQGNHYLSGFTGQSWTQFSGAGSVTAGTGITVDGLEVSIDRTTVDTWYDAAGDADQAVTDHNVSFGVHGVSGDIVGTSDSQTLTNKTIDGGDNTLQNIPNSALDNDSITVNGYATALGSTVTLDTDDVSEGTNQYFTQTRARDSFSEGTGINIATGEISVDIAAFDSDDISEGTGNLYFTDGRAADAAATLLTAANLTNITITGTGAGLTITAENGVADSDTDDLDEGTSNLYFTDQRAIDAIQNTTPVFSAVDIDSVAKNVAATVSAPTMGSQITAYSFAKADYRSAEFLVRTSYGTHTEISKVLLTLDTLDNIAITEYGTIGTNGSAMTVTADVSGSDVRLRVTPANNSSTVTVVGTLLA